jgi:Icc-related predicted phosphoesterase
MSLKVLHISDTHGEHHLLKIPNDLDMVICSGDVSNQRSPYENEAEVRKFLDWYEELYVPIKILVPGNHDTSIEKGLVKPRQIEERGIKCLIDQSIEIEGLKIWGSPWTPTFGNGWVWNRRRDKLHDLWMTIPEDTDIVVTHGPPMGIMDISRDKEGTLEFCGCTALKKRMLKIEPRYHMFGHIHNYDNIINAGTVKLSAYRTIFSNGSVVTDGKFGNVSSHGNLFTI